MYTLYHSLGACSVATQVVLRQLNQSFEVINKNQVADFTKINPTGTVPALVDGNTTITEGAAILLHILDKQPNDLLPPSGIKRSKAIEEIMFANATMHPAYGRLFFLAQNVEDEDARLAAFNASAQAINKLWSVVESKLQSQPFIGGDKPSVADILLSVYATWGAYFPVDIVLGENVQKMLNSVQSLPSFKAVVATDKAEQDTHE